MVNIISGHFRREFLAPILEINKEGKAAIFGTDTELYSISQTADNRVVLYNTYSHQLLLMNHETVYNVNLTRVIKALNCVKQTESFFRV